MSIESIYGGRKALTCNNCEQGIELDSWEDCREYMDESGWIARKEMGEWVHYCPECQEVEWG